MSSGVICCDQEDHLLERFEREQDHLAKHEVTS